MLRKRKVSNPKMAATARKLRRDMPVPERLLWSRLRAGQLGVRFRRQHPIEPLGVDFYYDAAQLAEELDGLSHEGRKAEDVARQRFLEQQGCVSSASPMTTC